MTDSQHRTGAYDSAGVRVTAAGAALSGLTGILRRTWPDVAGPGRVVLDFGHYANVIDLGGGQGLAICTDGVGSKAMIAEMTGVYDTIGIDCVAMNVNDLVCVGARPLTLVDYVAVEWVEPEVVEAIARGLAVGAERAGVSVSGGEIAELPDMIRGTSPGNGFDLAATAVGTVALDRVLVGAEAREGDAVVGIASSGIHSNGMTLARRVLFDQGGLSADATLAECGRSVGEELLEPTHIYVAEALALLAEVPSLRALVHITGDGLLNLPRLEAPVGFVLDALPPPPPVFGAIAGRGNVAPSEMYAVYNMGVGLCAVVASGDAEAAIAIAHRHGKEAWRIGTVGGVAGEVRIAANPVTGTDLAGRGKTFRHA